MSEGERPRGDLLEISRCTLGSRAIRKEIELLGKQKVELLGHDMTPGATLKAWEAQLEAERVHYRTVIQERVRRAQGGDLSALSEILEIKAPPEWATAYIREICGRLPRGIGEAERKAKIEKIDERIKKLEEKDKLENWPKDRYVFNDRGEPLKGRDRFEEFFKRWRHHAGTYSTPVDWQGHKIEAGSVELRVYMDHGFDSLEHGTMKPLT